MFSRIWFINLLLVLCASFLGWKAYGVWSGDMRPALDFKPADIRKGTHQKEGVKPIPPKKVPPEAAYNVVVGKNLFAPQRKEIKPEAPKPAGNGPPQAPKENPAEVKKIEASLKTIVVYGVVVSDDYQGALVTDVKKTPPPVKRTSKRRSPKVKRPAAPKKGSGKSVKWVQIGDELGDFEVADIMKDRLVLKSGSKNYELLVFDKEKPKARKAVVAQAKPTIISTSAAKKGSAVRKKGSRPPRTRTVKKSTTSKAKEEARRIALEKLRRDRAKNRKKATR